MTIPCLPHFCRPILVGLLALALPMPTSAAPTPAPQWRAVELEMSAQGTYESPYTEVEVWATFTHESGLTLIRPAFWDGGSRFKVRFASPLPSGLWTWKSDANVDDPGLRGRTGELVAGPNTGCTVFDRHGFWTIPSGSRYLRHADAPSHSGQAEFVISGQSPN